MATDRARNSYDATRQYRSVVAQQGRVTVEADANEAELIRTLESRADLIDIIGPTGTPDHGYEIRVPASAPFDFKIGKGTIYVGGLRLHLDERTTYEGQKPSEWTDCPSPDPDVPEAGPRTEIVYLELEEKEVTAVEDHALREVALGGPDTSARTRLIQRVRRGPTTATECEAALVELLAKRSPGLVHDRETMELRSQARLTVDFVPVDDDANECQPIAKAGFLGAENQLIRVQVAADGSLLWGYDNASHLYRVKAPTATPVNALVLEGLPVDEYHRPRPHQWVEVLRTAVTLDGESFVAAPVGELHEVASYDATTNTIALTTSVTAYGGPQLFVRVWENRLPNATTATELVDAMNVGNGVRVQTSGTATPGEYWMIGVRPTHPDKLYPARLRSPQPPDGPKRWATSLATIAWNKAGTSGFVHDCRRPFKPLTEDDDLAFHNKHLHGWGVVCGLQVRCMTSEIADRYHLERPREWVSVFNGYAIDPEGHDIRLTGAEHGHRHLVRRDKFTPLDLGELSVLEGVLQRDANGTLSDGTVSLWIDRHRAFHVDKFEPKRTSWQDLLEGTLLLDIYNDCILKVIEYVRGEITPGATDGLVGPSAKRLIAVMNLVIQLINQTSGRYVYLSGETDPARRVGETEDSILRLLFEGLRKLLESKSFCAMYEGVNYPSYNVYRAGLPADGPRPTTIFGTGHHHRIRINSRRQMAFTCRDGSTINSYDLRTKKILAKIEFPVSDAQVQDVAFSPAGDEIYAIAWIGSAKVDSMFVVGDINADGTVTWSTDQVSCSYKLCTLAATEKSPNQVFASARGRGVVVFNLTAITAGPQVVQPFQASGHLVAMVYRDQTFLYAGEHTTDANPIGFNQIRRIGMAYTPNVQIHKTSQNDDLIGYDDIAIAYSPNDGVDDLYAIVDGPNGEKQLLIWADREPEYPSRSVPLGTAGECHIAYSPAANWSLISYDNRYLGRAYRPESGELESGIHPLQIMPISVATDATGEWFYVLEYGSNTITAIPAKPTTDEPWVSTIDTRALEEYRLAAIRAFISLLGRFVQYLKDCVCDHLLVNCPDGRGKKVYLADITFKNGEVYQICNFHHRRYVHTFPTVEYWMSLVPILPLVKQAVEKLCCKVFEGVFDKYMPPQDQADDRSDILPMTMVKNGLMYAKQSDFKTQIKTRKMQMFGGAMLAKSAVAEKFARPPAGNVSAPVDSITFLAGSTEEATKVASEKKIAVRRVVVASDPVATAFKVGLAVPTIQPGETVDLITDGSGKVIGLAKATPENAPATEAHPEVTTLKRDLQSMQEAHKKQLDMIAELRTELKQLKESVKVSRPPQG